MRTAGVVMGLGVLILASASAQPPAVPGMPIPPPAAKPADPKLDVHLQAWEKKMSGTTNLRTEIGLKRKDAVFNKEREFTGVVLCMKPTFAVLRLDYTGDPTKADYEAYICDGKSVYAYSGKDKTITEVKLPQNQVGVDNLMLDFLSGMKAKDAKERFDIDLFKVDDHYVYLDIKPLRPADQREFKNLRLALYGPGAATAKVAYLPAQVFMVKPNGDSEMWKFTNPQTDLPGVDAKAFQFVPIKGWQHVQAQPPGPLPKGPVAPFPPPATPGAVRPNK
ncbi:MAG: TIGR03009 domain-containing protein [Planctomycetes bacterium]|nr:TIGR03009 domain-containing protein [Planctomycetota bacterium]